MDFDAPRSPLRSSPRVNLQTPLASLIVILAAATGCRSTEAVDPTPAAAEAIQTPSSPRARLEAAARAEFAATSAEVPRADVPAPPGVDPKALAQSTSERARLDLAAALADVASTSELELPREPSAPAAAVSEEDAAAALSLYLRGRQAALDSKPLVAVTDLRKALELDPGSVAIKRELANLYLRLNGMPTAVGLFVQILAQEPEDSEALLNLAAISGDRRDFEQAAAILARAWELPVRNGQRFWHDSGADVVAYHVLAEALHELGYDRAAMQAATESVSVQLGAGTLYARRLESIYRQRSELWRMIGDGHCRLAEYREALAAYERASLLPTPDPGGLTARVVYANLCLGRPRLAQFSLLGALEAQPEQVGDREISLCRYLAAQTAPADDLAAAVEELYAAHRDEANLARAAATLMPRPRSTELLREFVARRPRDTEVVTELLSWLSDEDLAGAVALAVELVRDHPDLAEENVRRLVVSGPRATELLRAARTLPASPARTGFEARLLAQVEALGRAWAVCGEGLRTWPDDDSLLLLKLDLAGLLGERDLIEEALDDTLNVPGHWAWIARSRVLGGLGDADAAVEAARRAVALGELRTEALLALALAEYLLANESTDEVARQRAARAAAAAAEEVIALDPARDGAHEVLVNVYRSNGILGDAGELGRVAERLREQHPNSRLLALLVAQDMINQGRFDPALDRLLTLYASEPTDGISLSLAVAIWSQLDRVDDALRWLEGQRLERPGDPQLLEQWTRLQLERGNVEDTMRDVRAEAQRDPENDIVKRLLESCYIAADRVEDAVEIGRQRLETRPRGVARELGLAAMYQRARMDDEALNNLEWILKDGDAADHDDLLSALAIASDLDSASDRRADIVLGLAERIIDDRSDAPMRVYVAALLVLAQRGELDGAFDTFARRAVEMAPGGSDATTRGALLWQRLAQTLVDADQPAGAARALRARLYAVAPLDPDARALLTLMTVTADAAAGGEVDKTIGLLVDLEARGELPVLRDSPELPPLPGMLYEASQAYSIVGDDQGADRLLREVLARQPEHAMSLNNVGYLRLESPGAAEDAAQIIEWIEAAYALQPTDSNILDTLGWLRYKQGRLDDRPTADPSGGTVPGALSLIRSAIERSEDPSAELFDHLGDVLYRSGQEEEAVEAWQRARRWLQDDERRQQTLQQYLLIQTRLWQLLVADPEELWQRDYGRILERVQRKLDAIASGQEPDVAAQFPGAGTDGS